jgi:hypothetical protein
MSETTTSKIQILLEKAARQNESPTREASSAASAARFCQSAAETEELFSRFHQKLFRINQWNSDSAISSFELFDEKGDSQPEKRAVLGDFIKITLPGSGKSDWVKIIEIDETPMKSFFLFDHLMTRLIKRERKPFRIFLTMPRPITFVCKG